MFEVKRKKVLEELNARIEEIRDEWRASDGGLTWAAGEALSAMYWARDVISRARKPEELEELLWEEEEWLEELAAKNGGRLPYDYQWDLEALDWIRQCLK